MLKQLDAQYAIAGTSTRFTTLVKQTLKVNVGKCLAGLQESVNSGVADSSLQLLIYEMKQDYHNVVNPSYATTHNSFLSRMADTETHRHDIRSSLGAQEDHNLLRFVRKNEQSIFHSEKNVLSNEQFIASQSQLFNVYLPKLRMAKVKGFEGIRFI